MKFIDLDHCPFWLRSLNIWETAYRAVSVDLKKAKEENNQEDIKKYTEMCDVILTLIDELAEENEEDDIWEDE